MEILVFDVNCVDPDQTPRSAASDLVLHCFSMSILWDARHIWVKLPYLLYVFGKTGLSKQCRLNTDAAKCPL